MAGGRPLKYQSVAKLQADIDAYFARCAEDKKPFTITGLALALDTTRQTLCDYEHKDQFTDTIKRAKLRCESFAEELLLSGTNAAGSIFALKNYGWRDQQDIKHTGNVTLAISNQDAEL